MAISADYITLQRAVADEIGDRTDLLSPLSDSSLSLSPVQNAIQSAISLWEREGFYFNQVYTVNAFSTVAHQETYTSSDYAAIATLPSIKKLRILINSQRYYLTPRTWEYIDEISVNPSSYAPPYDWAYFAEQIRLYPIPDAVYPITVSGVQRLSALSANSDANAWTQDAYDLIRAQAKLILAQEVLHDPDLAVEMKKAIYGDPELPGSRGYLAVLQGETTRRTARGRIRPTHF